ncbi:MAG: histidine kinase, partial [Eubacteriales bacterium]|nr:histidine kinase [Eubacteriales bacterium]
RIALQNTQLITNNIDSMLVNANYVTKMIMTNGSVQEILVDKKSFNSPAVMQVLRPLIASITNLQPYTAGVYLFNTQAQRYGMDNYTLHTFSFQKLEDAPWYPDALAMSGYYILRLNGGEAGKLFGNQNVISMIRLVYNIEQPTSMIGAVMLNLREDYFISTFEDFEQQYNAEVSIIDENGRPLFSREQKHYEALSGEQRETLLAAGRTAVGLPVKDETHISYSSMETEKAPWHVIVALPYTGEIQGFAGARNLFVLLLIMEALLIFFGTLIITRLVAKPIQHLTNAMRLTENAHHPQPVDMPEASGEIGVLKDTYNRMVDQIEVLFKRIEDESERKRQAEFHALQAQINPHFLYNTIDTARGLVMTGRAADVNRLLRNLGEFYRNSINNGCNVITLREEIHMVRSYMDIQQIRYADIQTVYDVDDTVCDVKIPKLVLQPLVENALYHGIRPRGNRGTIELKVWGDANLIYVRVADDGVGIDPETVKRVFDESATLADRFGLQGTIDRLRLFYQQDHVLSIEYGVAAGTRMTLLIPRQD